MITRIISGIIAAAIIVILLLLPPFALALTVFAASSAGLYELYKALKNKSINIDVPVSLIAAAIITGRVYVISLTPHLIPGSNVFLQKISTPESMGFLLFILMLYLFCRVIFSGAGFKPEDMAYTLFGIAYIPFLMSFAIMIRNLDRGFEYIWLILIGSVITDVFAYFTGVTVGKHKIIPHISPKKTVGGSLGGAAGCMLFMILYGAVIINRGGEVPIPLYHFAILGLLCGVIAQLGDWSASAIKRYTGIKDFGNLIPGHGGIMDRADSFLFVAPFVYIYISLFISA
ncbi:MAG TPA: phosphatidate cytidylyltransferase [Clostridiaceae bacterium]|nr:phosphatidate cytidylyltransferase [Clostridiaceae bacterium]